MNILAYASSTRPNHIWSAAQYDSALPKNRTDADIPLVSKADADAEIERLRSVLSKIESAPAWGYPDKWETTPAEVRQLARAALSKQEGAE